jgi:hypothetical protein
MADYEIQRERIVERPVTERVVEREVPTGRRTIIERRDSGYGPGFNPVAGIIMALVVVLLVLLLFGVLV